MRRLSIFVAMLTVGVVAESAHAQVAVSVPVPWYRPSVGYGGYYAAGYTPAEGYQRGMADVIRSSGDAAESFSRARINNEIARSKYLDNKLKWTQIYWQRKRLGEAELAKDYAEDRARRDRWLASIRDRKPETLSPSQYDAQSGEVEWPDALQDPIYSEYRRQIEEELDARAQGESNESKIRVLAREMQNVLKDQIREMNANEYIASRKFLDRLVNQMAMAQGY